MLFRSFALIHEQLDLSTINDGMLADTRVQALADRIEIQETLPDTPGHPPAEIVVHCADGSRLEMRDKWRSAIGDQQVREKFLACLAASGVKQGATVWERIVQPESSLDVGGLFARLEARQG